MILSKCQIISAVMHAQFQLKAFPSMWEVFPCVSLNPGKLDFDPPFGDHISHQRRKIADGDP